MDKGIKADSPVDGTPKQLSSEKGVIYYSDDSERTSITDPTFWCNGLFSTIGVFGYFLFLIILCFPLFTWCHCCPNNFCAFLRNPFRPTYNCLRYCYLSCLSWLHRVRQRVGNGNHRNPRNDHPARIHEYSDVETTV